MRLITYIVLALVCVFQSAHAFEIVNEKRSFENNRFFSYNIGMGINQFVNTKNIDSANPGFVFQTGISHRFNQWLEAQFIYQLSTMRFNSPDPIAPGAKLQSRAGLNQEYVMLKAFYPNVVAQPYIGVGFGGYQFFGVNGETALNFPASMEVPIGAGFQTFIYSNSISLDFDFTYHKLFGQGQDPTTLSILGVNEVSFDMYSLIGSFSFHFL